MSGTSQISGAHRQRLAAIYIRQSTLAQVRDNTESTSRQYALAEMAVTLGWDAANVLVIDADLGISGRSAAARPGYKELVSRVCLGEVGAIFGLEVSRLARSSADFQRLLEFCQLTDTLIVDADGIYDLRRFNDRLLLGLKGTMSEAELHILAGRLQESKRAAAARGELRFSLPIGYVHDDEGRTVMDPHEEIRCAIADVFAAFAASGSAFGVMRAFAGRPFPRRAGGAWAGEIRWGKLSQGRAQALLHNPSYAGAYVFGRFRSRRRIDGDGTIRSTTVELPQKEWAVLLQDHHPAYISWATYLANQQRLAANCTHQGARPAREGAALLQGIVRCGACAHPMSTSYAAGISRYDCSISRCNGTRTSGCRSVSATRIDAAVSHRLLEAVSADQIALAIAAADTVCERRARASRALALQVERARYEAERAARAFHACEPENRLVARSLEQRWEAKLGALAEAEAALALSNAERPPLPGRAELTALATDLPGLWNAPTTSAKDRKRLLRTLISDVTLTSQAAGVGEQVRIGIRWHSGATEEIVLARPGAHHSATPAEAVEIIAQLAGRSDSEICERLTAAGLRTGVGDAFDVRAVRWVRHVHRIPSAHADRAPDELTTPQLAARLGVGVSVIHRWIRRDRLSTRRTASGRIRIAFSPVVEGQCRRMIAGSSRIRTRTPETVGGGAV